jgi:fucose 4-O-acetylase-like acetyltransferase
MRREVQQSGSERIAWIDSAKGIGITLVVFAHVLGGANGRGWFGDGEAARTVYDYVYLFHMPLFFLISGILGVESMRTRPLATLDSRIRGIAWPYVLWGLIGMAILPLISRFMLSAPSDGVSEGLWKLLTGQASWFLWTLFVMEVLLIVPVARAPLSLLVACSLLIYAISTKYAPFGIFSPVVRNAPFFLIGCIFASHIRELRSASTLRQSAGFVVTGVLLFATLALVMSSVGQSELLYLFGGIIGSAATIACTLAIRGRLLQRTLQSVGMGSLAIFLLHPYFQGIARELLITFAKFDPRFSFAFIVLAALVGPWITWQLASKFGLGWLFRLPPHRKAKLV